MSDAPKRIYAWVHRDLTCRDSIKMTHNWHGEAGGPGNGKTKYVRADIANEMLEALNSLIDGLQDIRGIDIELYVPRDFDKARAAIAKAEENTYE